MKSRCLLLLLLLAQLVAAQPLRLSTPGGTPLVGAVIIVEKLDGTRYNFTLGPEGTITVTEVPLGVLKVQVVSWKGVPVGYSFTVTPHNYSVTVPGIYPLTVTVVGARGQGLARAVVKILYDGKGVERGVTDESGVYRTLLPAARYVVVAEYGGRSSRREVDLRAPGEVRLQLDVFGEIGGLVLSSSEFMGLIALAVVLSLALFVIAYEYSQWRRKRLLKVVSAPQRL